MTVHNCVQNLAALLSSSDKQTVRAAAERLCKLCCLCLLIDGAGAAMGLGLAGLWWRWRRPG